jgi:hypothetical protein
VPDAPDSSLPRNGRSILATTKRRARDDEVPQAGMHEAPRAYIYIIAPYPYRRTLSALIENSG